MRHLLMQIYWWFESRLVPELRYSQSHYEDILSRTLQPGAAWLDVGCGHQVLPPWRRDVERALVERSATVVGVDLDLPAIRRHATIRMGAVATLDDLPFPNDTFDLVTANMVAEHLAQPELQFAEIARVLRPDGRFVFHTPNRNAYTARLARLLPERLRRKMVRILEGRREEDVFPTFYRVNTEERIREVAAGAGLEVLEVRAVMSSAEFAPITPVAILELLWLRRLARPEHAAERQTFIGILHKPAAVAARDVG